jgi:hypothetical protein
MMATSFGFFADAGLTTPATSLAAVQAADGSADAVDSVVYFGSMASGKKAQATSDPGVDPVYVSIADSATGAGLAATAVKLAASSGGLGAAIAGNPLSLGAQVLSGSANAVAVHVRIKTPAVAVGNYTDLSLVTPDLTESAV